jgi:hypothetical protein
MLEPINADHGAAEDQREMFTPLLAHTKSMWPCGPIG